MCPPAVFVSVCLPICQSVYLSGCPFVMCQSICLSVYVCQSVHLSVCLSVHLSVHLSIRLSVFLFVKIISFIPYISTTYNSSKCTTGTRKSQSLETRHKQKALGPVCLSVCRCVCLGIHLCVSPSISLFVCLLVGMQVRMQYV